MSIRFVKEGIQNIWLGAQMSNSFASKLPIDQINVSGPIIDQDDYHILLEYKTGEKYGSHVSPRANRLIVHSDDNNAKLVAADTFLDGLQEFHPNIVIISGMQMMDNSQVDFSLRSAKIKQIGLKLSNVCDEHSSMRVHFEMASYTEQPLLSSIVQHVFPLVHSYGMNEQEVVNLLSLLKYGNMSYATNSSPRVAHVLDDMRQLYSLLSVASQDKISRVHVHTLAYQVVLVRLNQSNDDNQPIWPNAAAAMAKASLTSFRHTVS